MNEEQNVQEGSPATVTVGEVIDALYTLSRLGDDSGSSLNDIQFQVGGKASRGRHVNRVLVKMLNEGVVEACGKRAFKLREEYLLGASKLFDIELTGRGLEELRSIRNGAPASLAGAMFLENEGLFDGTELTPTGESVLRITDLRDWDQ